MSATPFDLAARAHRAMVDAGFYPDFPAQVLAETAQFRSRTEAAPSVQDLRRLAWSSIDNDTSRYLDQV
jgi:exoribonuclease-2